MQGRTVRTPKNREHFIEALKRERSVAHACAAVGIGRTAAYSWRTDDPAFRAAWDEAIAKNLDDLEASAMRRAIEGTKEPITNKDGKVIGHRVKHETALTIFMLKANRPEKYHLERREGSQGATDFLRQCQTAYASMRDSVPI